MENSIKIIEPEKGKLLVFLNCNRCRHVRTRKRNTQMDFYSKNVLRKYSQ